MCQGTPEILFYIFLSHRIAKIFHVENFEKSSEYDKKKRLTAFFFVKFFFRRRSRPPPIFFFHNFSKTAYFTILQFFSSVAALKVYLFHLKLVFFSIFQYYFCLSVKTSGFSRSFTYTKSLLSYH